MDVLWIVLGLIFIALVVAMIAGFYLAVAVGVVLLVAACLLLSFAVWTVAIELWIAAKRFIKKIRSTT